MEERTAKLIRLRRLFQQRFPVFRGAISKPSRPLKIGIHKDIFAAAPDIPKAEVMYFLRSWTRRIEYLRGASAVGWPRHDLDGNVCGEIAPAEAEWATAAVVANDRALAAKRDERAAADAAEAARRAEQRAREEKKKADLAELEKRRAEKKANRERDAILQERARSRKAAAELVQPAPAWVAPVQVRPAAPAPPAAPVRAPVVEVKKSRAVSRPAGMPPRPASPAAPSGGTLRLGLGGKLSLRHDSH